MAPVLKPEELKQDYVYGLDAESIRKEFLTHLEITLAELPEHVDSAHYARATCGIRQTRRPFNAHPEHPGARF
jgi:hypothetical protein